MAFFNNKEDMFNHRADRFKRDEQEAERRVNTTKLDWCRQ